VSDVESGTGPTGIFSDLPSVENLPFHPMHVRVLDLQDSEERSAVFSAWQVDQSPNVFFQQVRERVESALLTELSLPCGALHDGPPAGWDWCRLLSFHPVPATHLGPLEILGFFPCKHETPIWTTALSRLRSEAQHVGFDIEAHQTHSFEARVEGRRKSEYLSLARELSASLGDEAWGAQPGHYWRQLARLLEVESAPTLEALDELEKRLVSSDIGVIRWIQPSLIQAACDLVGAIAAQQIGLPVQWAHCEADERGLAPPPLLRVDAGDELVHIPIALHIMRWWVMPLRHGEEPSPLSAWIRDQFGDP